jgi:hypothetical protein
MYHLIQTGIKITTLDCFDLCDVVREKYTTYLGDRNMHVFKEGKLAGTQWFGCMCK